MTEQTSNEELRKELQEIDETLRRLRHERGTNVDEVGDQSDAATDATSYAEEQALIENLEERHRRLTAKLQA
jgi:chorismate mutase